MRLMQKDDQLVVCIPSYVQKLRHGPTLVLTHEAECTNLTNSISLQTKQACIESMTGRVLKGREMLDQLQWVQPACLTSCT